MSIKYQLVIERYVSTGIGMMHQLEVEDTYDKAEDAFSYMRVLKQTFPLEDASYRVEAVEVDD